MQKDGQKISIGLEAAESYGKLALETAADRAKALDVLAHVAEAKCLFQLAKQRCAAHSNLVKCLTFRVHESSDHPVSPVSVFLLICAHT